MAIHALGTAPCDLHDARWIQGTGQGYGNFRAYCPARLRTPPCHLNALCMTPHVPLARRLVSPTRHSCRHNQRQVRGWCQVVRASAAVQTKTLKIGTRGSPLALAQAYLTRRLLQVCIAQQPESSTKQAEKALPQALPVAHTHHGLLPCGGCQSHAACEALGDAVPMLLGRAPSRSETMCTSLSAVRALRFDEDGASRQTL